MLTLELASETALDPALDPALVFASDTSSNAAPTGGGLSKPLYLLPLPNLCPALVENLDIEFLALVEYLDIDSPILCLFL